MDKYILFILFGLMVLFGTSFYQKEAEKKDQQIEQLSKQVTVLKNELQQTHSYLDTLLNSTFKFKVKEIGGRDVVYIFNREALIKTNYDVDTTYFNKLYRSSSRYDSIPFWLVLYYAHIESKFRPYNKHGRVERSEANAYNIMQVTWQAMNHVNETMGTSYKWYDVKYDVDTNIDCAIDYMKADAMDAFYAFDQNPKLSYLFYNAGPNIAKHQLNQIGLLPKYLAYLKSKME